MKKILVFMMLVLSATSLSVEVLDEFYVMEKVITFLNKEATYDFNGTKVKAKKVDSRILKALATTDTPFYFFDSNNKRQTARIGDYLISPLTLSEIYTVEKRDFEDNYIKQ